MSIGVGAGRPSASHADNVDTVRQRAREAPRVRSFGRITEVWAEMAKKKPSIAIIGAGMGGLAVAATLRRVGIAAQIYEQAPRFARIGAGIQMMPNSMKVLRGIGVEERLRGVAFAPYSHLNRVWDSGAVTRELPMPESLYGAPYLCMHRAELHEALAAAVPAESIHLGKKLTG